MSFFYDTIKRIHKASSAIFGKLNTLQMIFILTVGVCFVASIFNLHDLPDSEKFLSVFFKEPFIMIIGVCVAWFISSFRATPSRRKEFIFLNSLPISGSRICNRFIGKEILQYWWVPGVSVLLFLSLLSVAPVSHLCRLCLLTLFVYIIFIVTKLCLHIIVAIKRRGFEGCKYPDQNDPILMVLLITGFAIGQLVFIVNPFLSSGTLFVIVLGVLTFVFISLLFLTRKVFNRWKNENLAFRMKMNRSGKIGSTEYPVSNPFQRYPRIHPILIKNILRIIREKNTFSILLTVVFISCAYLLSLNNEKIRDTVSVLFGILCIYTILFSYRSINLFGSDSESPNLIYLLPFKKRDLYLPYFIPLLAWVSMVAFIFTILILISGSSLESAGLFLLKSMAAGSICLQGAINYALAAYPDNNKAKKQFGYWCIFLLIFSAIIYRYAIIVICLMVFLSFYKVGKIKLYKVT